MTGAQHLDAVLWDMDGVLVDSEPLWTVAEAELAAQFGREWTDQIKALIVGTRLDVAVPAMLRYFDQDDGPAMVERTSRQLLGRMVELYGGTAHLMPGAGELLAALRRAGVPIALVSSSFRVLVDAVLAQGVGPFEVTVAGDEVVEAKPHPEPYLTAARRLGVDPTRCVVVEDSPSGVAAGEAAGCAVLAVPSVAGVVLHPGPRRRVVRDLTGVTIGDLQALAGQPVTAAPANVSGALRAGS